MSAPATPKYRTTNRKGCNTALEARGSLLIRLDRDICWHGSASGKRGRRPKYSEAALQFCLTIKRLFNPAPRQAMDMAQSVLMLAGLDWQVPGFSTVSRRQEHLPVTIAAQTATSGLHLPVNCRSVPLSSIGSPAWARLRLPH